jgi:hypothetical protein
MWTYHLTTRFQVSPNSGVMASMCKIKGLHNDGRQNLFHMLLPPKLAIGILRSLDAVKKFRSCNCGNDGLDICELAQNPAISNFPLSSAIRIEVSRISPMLVYARVNWRDCVRDPLRMRGPLLQAIYLVLTSAQPVACNSGLVLVWD